MCVMRRFLFTIALVMLVCGGSSPAWAQPEDGARVDSETVEATAGDAESSDQPNESNSGTSYESKASKERTIPGGTLAVGFGAVTARRQTAVADELKSLEGRMDDVLDDLDAG